MHISDRREFIQKGLFLAGTAGLMASGLASVSQAQKRTCSAAKEWAPTC